MNYLKKILLLVLISFIIALTLSQIIKGSEPEQAEEFPMIIVIEPVVNPNTAEPEAEPETAVLPEDLPILTDLLKMPHKAQEAEEPEEPELWIDCKLERETQKVIADLCEQYDVPFTLVMAVAFCESNFTPDAVAYDGSSIGLMQIHRINHQWLSDELGITDWTDPVQNAEAGIFILSDLLQKYEPNRALMAYNMGEYGAQKLWNQGITSSAYAEKVLLHADIFQSEIDERMGEK